MGKGESIRVEKPGHGDTEGAGLGDEKQGHSWRGRLSGHSPGPEGLKCQGGHDSSPVSPLLIGTNSF